MPKIKLTTFENLLQLLLIVVVLPLLVYWTIQREKNNYGVCYDVVELDSTEVPIVPIVVISTDTIDGIQLDTILVPTIQPQKVISLVPKKITDSTTLDTLVTSVSIKTQLPEIEDSNRQILDTNSNPNKILIEETKKIDTTSITPTIQPRVRRKFLFFK